MSKKPTKKCTETEEESKEPDASQPPYKVFIPNHPNTKITATSVAPSVSGDIGQLTEEELDKRIAEMTSQLAKLQTAKKARNRKGASASEDEESDESPKASPDDSEKEL